MIMILQDDLGEDDLGYSNPEKQPYSASITALAKEGLILDNAYVHWHCVGTT